MDYSYYFVPNPTPEQVRQTYEFLSGISLLFHYKLRKIRDRAKLSLDEMARVVGAQSGEEIESYEEANSRPSFFIASRYAEVTGIPLVLMVDDDIDTGDFRKILIEHGSQLDSISSRFNAEAGSNSESGSTPPG